MYILRPNRDQLRKMQLQGLPAGNRSLDPGSLDQHSIPTELYREKNKQTKICLLTTSVNAKYYL